MARRAIRGRFLPHAHYGVAKVPDTYVEPFVAYRAWNWNSEGITSLNRAMWTPKQAFEAQCPQHEDLRSMQAASNTPEARAFWAKNEHHVPDPNCTCGMYAGINMQHLIDINYIQRGIHGEVSLWGRLYRHTLGWRAQYAYPKNFIVPANMIPVRIDEAKRRLDVLTEFEVEIYLQYGEEAEVGQVTLPLWLPDYGYSQQGLSLLVERGQRWDAEHPKKAHPQYRRPYRRVQPLGDRERHRDREGNQQRQHVLHDVQSERDLQQASQGRPLGRAELALGDERTRHNAQAGAGAADRAAEPPRRGLRAEGTMKPTTIDVVGTVEQLAKWVFIQALIFLAVIAFGLSAPILFSLGALWLAVNFPDSAPTWAVLYLIAGPFACAFWMIILSRLPIIRADWKAAKAGLHVERSFNEHMYGAGKAMGFTFVGFVGSLAAEGVFTYAAHVLNVIPNHLILYFAIAPFAVFAPCWMVQVRRWIRRNKYATD